jgi:muconolactone delta-isomerase
VVEELQVILKTGKQVTDKTPSFPDPKAPETAFLIRFSYRGQWFHMWRVTWEYIVNGVADRDKEPAEFD